SPSGGSLRREGDPSPSRGRRAHVRRFWIPALVAAVALVGGGRAGGARTHCSQALPHGPALPAPLVVTTQCGRFRIQPSGAVIYKGPRASPVPRVASSYSPWISPGGASNGTTC